MNLEPGAYTVRGFVADAVEVRQRELAVRSFSRVGG